MPWSSWFNAEVYDRFVRERRIYGWLNQRLVELAGVRSARNLLDLACGTGATTVACLAEMDPTAEIVGIDASEEMVSIAAASVLDPRARFEVAAAAEADRVNGRFDRVVCNAAFWQFPARRPVFRALAAVTGPGARFVFNVPAERVRGEAGSIHPYQVALMREIQAEVGRPLSASPAEVDRQGLAAAAGELGFDVVQVARRVYECGQDELIELMAIPAMIQPLTPDLGPQRREAVLERARAKVDPDQRVAVPWLYFTLERRGRPGAAGSR